MYKRLFARSAWIGTFVLTPALFAQAPQRPATSAPAGTGLIVGQVVDADTKRGINGALVMLAPAGPAQAPVGELTEARTPSIALQPVAGLMRTLTTSDGRFVFRDVPRGRFSITATAPTHLLGGYGQLRPSGPTLPLELADAEKKGGVSVTLWRLGSITGTIRDDQGEPVVGAGAECFRRVISGGQKRYASQATLLYTDDRGLYRAGSLPPGDYICGSVQNTSTMPVAIAPDSASEGRAGGPPTPEAQRLSNSGGTLISAIGMRIGDAIFSSGAYTSSRGVALPPPDGSGKLMAFAPVYYAASSTTTQASVITLKAGEERTGVDMTLKLVPAVKVSGIVTSPAGSASHLSLRLVPVSGVDFVSEGQAEYSRTITDPSGAFTFLGIPAGQYLLKCRMYPRPAPGGNVAAALDEMSLWTSTPVTVADKDITNLSIALKPGIRASGRVEFTGTRPVPAAAELQRIGVRMQGAEGRTSSPISLDGRVNADATFKTAGYPAGRYIANVLPNTVPAGWSVKSIVLNGRDISVEPVELSDADVGGIVVTFTDQTTTLSGTVTGVSGLIPSAEVVVFPADSLAWKDIGAVARRSRVERVSEKGAFSITGLPPGDYFVAVVAGSTPGDRQDPTLLANLMREAQRVTLADGGTATAQLVVKR